MCNEIEGLMKNNYHHGTKLYWKKYHLFVAIGLLAAT